MFVHEKRCFRNPHRTCPLCDGIDGVADDIEALKAGGLPALRESAEGCPACIMSAILQSVKNPEEEWIEFDYKKERDEWNAEKYDLGMQGVGT